MRPNVCDDVAVLFAQPARAVPQTKSAELQSEDEVRRGDPVDENECTTRGKTMLGNGRLIRTSDVTGASCADSHYDFRLWLQPEQALHEALKECVKPSLPLGFGKGTADHIGRLASNFTVNLNGKRAGQSTSRSSKAKRRDPDICYAVAHDSMLMPCGLGLSSIHVVLRSFSQRLHRAEFRNFLAKTPGNFDQANRLVDDACTSPALFSNGFGSLAMFTRRATIIAHLKASGSQDGIATVMAVHGGLYEPSTLCAETNKVTS